MNTRYELYQSIYRTMLDVGSDHFEAIDYIASVYDDSICIVEWVVTH